MPCSNSWLSISVAPRPTSDRPAPIFAAIALGIRPELITLNRHVSAARPHAVVSAALAHHSMVEGNRSMAWYGGYGRWRPYVPVAKRRAKAASYAASLAKREKRELSPITIDGRKIAESFWGQAWCDNLEAYSDF